MKTPPGSAVRRNSSTSHTSPQQKRNSIRGNQDPSGQALGVSSPPSSTASRKMLMKNNKSMPTAPNLAFNKQKPAPPPSEATSVSEIGRRKLGNKEGLSKYQKKVQAKKDHDIIKKMMRDLRHTYQTSDPVQRKTQQITLKKQLKRHYGHLSSEAFKRCWNEACEGLEQGAGHSDDEEQEQGKPATSEAEIHVPRKRPSISAESEMHVPRKRPSISSEGATTIPRKRPSISSEGGATIPRRSSEGEISVPKKRTSISSEGDATKLKKKRKRLSKIAEEPNEVVILEDTDDEQEWGGEDDADNAKVAPKDTHQRKKKKTTEVPQPISEVDPFEKAGPNRWANLIVGPQYKGETFTIGEWDSIQPVVKLGV